MSEVSGEVAGRLVVPVETSTKGLRQRLKAQVEKAAKGIVAEVGIDLGKKKDLRKKIQAAVDEAAAGVTATVGIDLDTRGLKSKVEAAAKEAGAGVKVTVNADADTAGMQAEIKAAAAEAERTTSPVKVGLVAKTKAFLLEVAAARAAAQAEAAKGIDIPINGSGGGGLFGALGGGKKGGGPGLRTLFRGSVIFSLLSMIEPIVGGLAQVVAGLTAVTGAAAPAVGTLAALPVTLAAIVQGFVGGKVALQGFGQAMALMAKQQEALRKGTKLSTQEQQQLDEAIGELSPSAAKAAAHIVVLRGAWVKMRKNVQERLFSQIAGDIEPLAKVLLPILEKGLGRTAGLLGKSAHALALWGRSKKGQADLGAQMKTNNKVFGDFLYMLGRFGKGTLDFLRGSDKFARGTGKLMREIGDWFSGKMAKGRADGGIAKWLDMASSRAKLLWDIVKQFGGGMAGIFRAGSASGLRLLNVFDKFLTHWHKWVDSPAGQTYLADWFANAEGGFIEFSRMVNDTFKGIAKWAGDPKIEGLLKTIRTEFGPALSALLKSLSDDAAGGVTNLLTAIVRLASAFEPAIQVTGLLLKGVALLGNGLADLTDKFPTLTHDVALLVGGLIAMSVVGKITKLFSGLSVAMRTYRADALLVNSVQGQFPLMTEKVAQAQDRMKARSLALSGALKGLAGAGGLAAVSEGMSTTHTKLGILTTALGGAATGFAVGGPLGAAIGGLGGLVMGLAGHWDELTGKLKDKASYEAARAGVKSLTDAMQGLVDKSNEATQAIVKQSFLGKDGKTLGWVKDLGKAGVNQGTLADAILGNKDAQARVSNTLKGWGAQAQAQLAMQKKFQTDAEAYKVANTDKLSGHFNEKDAQGRNPEDVYLDLVKQGDAAGVAAEKYQKMSDVANDAYAQLSGVAPKVTAEQKKYADALGITLDQYNRMPDIVRKTIEADKGIPQTLGKVQDLITAAKEAGTAMKPRQVRWLLKTDGVKETAEQIGDVAKLAGINGDSKEGRKTLRMMLKAEGIKPSKEAVAGLIAYIKGQKPPPIPVKTDTHQAQSDVRSLKAEIESLRDRKIHITTVMNKIAAGSAGTKMGGSADGSTVPKDGRAYGDRYPYLLAPGEEVISNRHGQADKWRPVLKAINAGRLALGGTVRRLADGGTVSDILNLDATRPGGGKGKGKSGSGKSGSSASGGSHLSKAMKALGKWLTSGFVAGLTGNLDQVTAAANALWKRLDNTKMSNKRLKGLKKKFAAEIKELKDNARKRAALQRQLTGKYGDDGAQARLDSLTAQRSNVRTSLRDGARAFGNIASIASANGGFASPKFLIAQLRAKVGQAKEYMGLLKTLRDKGIGGTAYEQLVSLGFEEGLPLARQLAKASTGDLAQIKDLQAQLDAMGAQAADDSSKTLYDAGVNAATALVNTITKKQDQLNKVAESMATAMAAALKKALGLGGKKGKGGKKKAGGGLVTGPGTTTSDSIPAWLSNNEFVVKAKSVKKYGRGLFEALNAGKFSTGGLVSLAASGASARRTAAAAAAPSPGGHGLNIEHLELKAATPELVEDSMAQLRWELRRIEKGGVYADV